MKRKAETSIPVVGKTMRMTQEQKNQRDRIIEAHTVVVARLFRQTVSSGDTITANQFAELSRDGDKVYVFFYRQRTDSFPEIVRPFHRGGWLKRWEGALVEGRIWEPTPEWEEAMGSDTWSDIVAIEYGYDRIDIRRLQSLRNAVPGISRGRGLAFFPFYNDTALDLSAAQIFPRHNYPAQQIHCLQHTLLKAKEDMGDLLPFDIRNIHEVLMKYFKGGVGSDKIPSRQLRNIARDLACKFRIYSVETKFRKDKLGNISKSGVTLSKPYVVPSSQDFGVEIPVGIINEHIFYNGATKIFGSRQLCEHSGIPVSRKIGLSPSSQTPWSLMRVVHTLIHKYGKLQSPIPPDVSKRFCNMEFRDSTEEFRSSVVFDIISPVVSQDGDEDMAIHGTQKLYQKPKETKHPKPTHFYSADSETFTNGFSGSCQISALPLDLAVRDELPADRHQIYMIGLQHFLDSNGNEVPIENVGQIPTFSSLSAMFHFIETKHRAEALEAYRAYSERKYWDDRKPSHHVNEFSLKVILFFHNLKFDKAVIQSDCKIYSCCEKGGQIYEFSVLLPSSRILVCCRDSYKHISQPISSFQKVFDLPQDISKKEEGVIYEFFRQETRGQRVTLSRYIAATPRFFAETDQEYNNKCRENQAAVVRACCNLGVLLDYEVDSAELSFFPDQLYKRYLQYDILTLAEGLKIYRRNMIKVYQNIVGDTKITPEPLTKMTSSAFSRMVFEDSGATEGLFQYRASLRRYIMSSVRGGRCTPHPSFRGKEIPHNVFYFDGVSLYPSSFVQQVKLAGGFPKGPAIPLSPDQCEAGLDFLLDPSVSYAIVTVRILDIPRKLVFTPPIIAYKNPNDPSESLQYIQDLPNGQPFEVTVGLLDLLEYIKFHQIRFILLHGCYWDNQYGDNDIAGSVMTKFHEIRKRHKPKGPEPKDALSNAYKLCSNSIYGTTIMSPSDSTSEFWDMDDITEDNLPLKLMNIFDSIQEVLCLGKSLQVKRESYDAAFTFCLIGSIVLSRSRWIMNGLWAACERVGAYIFYTDTDSVWIPKDKLPAIETEYNSERADRKMPPLIGGELCQFHNDIDPKSFGSLWRPTYNADHIFATSMFIVARKVYLLKTAFVTPEGMTIRGISYKCKGLPKSALEWYCSRLPLAREYEDLDPEYPEGDSSRLVIQFYRDILCGIAHEAPLNPTSTRFLYDKRRFVFTTRTPIPRTISSKNHKLTYHGCGPEKSYSFTGGELEAQEEASHQAELLRLDRTHIIKVRNL